MEGPDSPENNANAVTKQIFAKKLFFCKYDKIRQNTIKYEKNTLQNGMPFLCVFFEYSVMYHVRIVVSGDAGQAREVRSRSAIDREKQGC